MIFFPWRKSIKEIEARARAKEREIIEKHYLKELEDQRKRYTDKMKEQEIKLIREGQEALDVKEEECKKRVKKSEDDLRDSQRAWLIYKDFIPEAVKCATMLKAQAFAKQQEATQKLGIVSGVEDGFESLERSLIELTPKVEKLMKL